jgi:hypothetical protein
MWYNAECMNEAEKCIQGLKLEDIYERKKSHGPRCRWEDDNKRDLEEKNWHKMESSDKIL